MGLKSILTGGVGDIVKGVTDVVDMFHTSDEEKAEISAKIASVVNERMAIIASQIQARFKLVTDVITAEMQHGNSYAKAARPSVVYAGLLIHMVNAFGQMFGLDKIEIDPNFTYVWGGVCSVWIVGRSAEKVGLSNKATQTITGSKALDIEL